jgi:hypothetical protein
LPEFGTVAALDYYNLHKRRAFGDFIELRANTGPYVKEPMPDLEDLDRMIEKPTVISGQLSLDDVRVLPLPVRRSREGDASAPPKEVESRAGSSPKMCAALERAPQIAKLRVPRRRTGQQRNRQRR